MNQGRLLAAGTVALDTSLRSAGLDTQAMQERPGESFQWHVRYDAAGERTTLDTNRGVALGAVPEIPENLKDPDALFLGSTDPCVQRDLLGASGAPRYVALDTMTHWIRDRRSELDSLLPDIDVLFVNAAELAALGGADADVAVKGVMARSLKWLVVKRGSLGATAYGTGRSPSVGAAPTRRAVDPTGAGDAFAGGLMGSLTESGSLTPKFHDQSTGPRLGNGGSGRRILLLRQAAGGGPRGHRGAGPGHRRDMRSIVEPWLAPMRGD